MNRLKKFLTVGALVAASVGVANQASAAAFSLTNGNLTVNVGDNGAISSLVFAGFEFYREGTFVADFGLQVGTNTASFRLNTINGAAGMAGSSTNPTWNGTYANGGETANISRTFSIVTGLDVLAVTTTITNTSTGALTFRSFDTFDPDQGVSAGGGFDTQNDVFSLAGLSVARATQLAGSAAGLSVVMGPGGPLGFHGFAGLEINTGSELNTFFLGPEDPNGAVSDIGFAIARELVLAPGATGSWTFFQAFGRTVGSAEAGFTAVAAPEPTSLLLLGGGLVAAGRRLRRRRAA